VSPFQFLSAEWPDVHEAPSKAAAAVYPDPRTACFYARRALELAVAWAFKSDESLHLPYQDNLSALIHDPTFKAVVGEAVFSKARVINTLGNQAVHIAIHKLRMNTALTRSDLDELERMLTTSEVGGAGDVRKAKEESHGLGLFVRSLVGLDREAAKQAFAGFLAGKALNANQIEFVNLIVDHLTEHGVMGAALLYESPFTDVTPRGPDGIFTSSQLDELLAVLDQVRASALAA